MAGMTTRERLNRRKRLTAYGLLGGLATTCAGIAAALTIDGAPVVPLCLGGIVPLVGAVLASQGFAVRCAGCAANLSTILMRGGGWRIDPKLRFCPYCAASLDAAPTDEPDADAAGW